MGSPWLVGSGAHFVDEGLGAEVGPVLFDEVEAGLAGVRAVDGGPAGGGVGEGGPEAVLAFVVDQDSEGAVGVVERVGHDAPSRWVARAATVRCWKSWRGVSGRPADWARLTRWMASMLSPPRVKKSSSMPRPGRPRTSEKTSTSAFSVGVRG